ncbi:MAG: hypothetical protein U0796_19000 [Gemmatales bacterium]
MQTTATSKRQLSIPRQQLIEVMQRFAFCDIRHLPIVRGEPVLAGLQVVHELKLGADNDPRIQLHLKDFILKKCQVELMEILDSVGDGVLESVEVKFGLPYRVRVTRSL